MPGLVIGSVRLVPTLMSGVLLLATRGAAAGTSRYLTEGYGVGAVHGAGGALGDKVPADAVRYSETNGALMDLMFGAPMRLIDKNAPKRIDCAAGACTYLDVTLWTPRFNKFAGGMYSAGVSFPFADGALLQLGIAIGFFDDGTNRHARDAIVVATAVPVTQWLYARMRADLNIYGAMNNDFLAKFKRNSPMSAGVTVDVGSSVDLTADVERYDFLRGGLGWSLGAAARF